MGNNATPSSSPDELLPDEQLVARALAGDKSAFNLLVVRHERRLYRFLAKSAANMSDVEDAMQQAMLKAYLHLARYNPRWRFTTWLFTIALRELRTLQRDVPITQRDASLEPAVAPVEHPIDNDDPGDLWRTARRLLAPEHYTALWLRHGEDLPVRDVARIMRRPRVWVSVTLHRACAALRDAAAAAAAAASPRSVNAPALSRTLRGVL